MDINSFFLIASTIFGIVTPVIGIRAILIGEYKPHRVTRVIFFILTLTLVLSLIAQNDRVGIFLALAQLLSTTVILFLSFKYGVGGTSKIDFILFISAIISLVIWKLTDNPSLALYMSILTDIIGISPTLVKSFKQPYTEDPKFYLSDTIAGLLNLLALRSFMLNEVAFPLYIFFINLLVLSIIVVRRRFKS